MTVDILINAALVLVFVLIGGVFAATEMALVTLRESQVKVLSTRGRRGERVAALATNPNRFLSAVQIGVTVAGFASAAFGATSLSPAVTPLLVGLGLEERAAEIVATLLLTLVIAYLSLVLGELAPKRLALQKNAQFAYVVAPVLDGFAHLMRPVIWLLSTSTNAVVRLLGGDPHQKADAISEEEFRDIVASHEGLPDDERRILDDVLSLRERQLSEVMQPRPEVIALDGDEPIAAAVSRARRLPFSRYPVRESSMDDLTGFVHVRDLLEAVAENPDSTVQSIARPVKCFPSTARVLPTLTQMRADGDHIAIVIDEYGGTDGIITLEDLVEEVVGEIFDEYDTARDAVGGATDIVDGRLNLQDFEEATGVSLIRGSSDTIAGFVVEQLGRLAAVGDVVEVDGATLQVVTMDKRRIAALRVIAAPPAERDDT
ncbi:putative hemolysin [Microcella putealis]|uniref:Putative hemolysin n=1 Tax=Microcella putealis TaxID=337005 RepID=A0A4Q7LPT5_9MICO|nr:hemolysin family protein [Microcella putealis]RZS56147.1 putative hemolysin [Microcella putealis]TQM23422.1 putative hemolysin [Microcella putealis]